MVGVRHFYTPPVTEVRSSDYPVISQDAVLLTGQVYQRGSVLGQISGGANDGKYVMSDPAAADGSQNIAAVLAYDVDATTADEGARVDTSGAFSDLALVFKAGGWTAATASAALRKANSNLYIEAVQPLQAY